MQIKSFAWCLTLLLATASWATAQEEKNKTADQKKGVAKQEGKLKVGDKAPDFEVKTFDDKTVKLSERFGKNGKPVILLFSRANW